MNIQKYILVKANNNISVESVAGDIIRLHDLQKSVGGWIEYVPIQNTCIKDLIFIVNEEGHMQNLPVNSIASRFYLSTPSQASELTGDVVIAKVEKGNTIGLTEKELRLVLSSLRVLS